MSSGLESVDLILVDDNINDAELALRVVRKTAPGTTHVHLEDGERAIAHFDALACAVVAGEVKLPRLLLLDLKLPKVDGLDVLRHIRGLAVFQSLPVVVLSSSREISDVERAYVYGANSFVVKPVQFDQYLPRIGGVVSYWLTLNELPRAV
jgi:two-component system response regulator